MGRTAHLNLTHRNSLLHTQGNNKLNQKMEMHLGFFLVLIANLAFMHLVQAQTQDGFISLDCGLPPKDSPYTEPTTKITYESDTNFTERGESRRIKEEYYSSFLQQAWTLRSFPEGNRNCYNLNVTKGRKYLISASFTYGNYDDKNELPSFDLHIGPNKWASVDIRGAANGTSEDIIHIPSSDQLQICLVKTGSTTPFISALELRPLDNNSYVTKNGSLSTFFCDYLTSNSNGTVRFSDDIHDRGWHPFFIEEDWTQLSTTLHVDTSNDYDLPQVIMRTAATPKNTSAPLEIQWDFHDPDTPFHLYLHFAEIERLKANETREFNITLNDELFYQFLKPSNLSVFTVYSDTPRLCDANSCVLKLLKTERSTHPPLLNAIEVYTIVDFPQSETEPKDVDAIKNIKSAYGLKRISWQGDPCAPQESRWDGLNCSYLQISEPPRITSLNLSSSGLTGKIVSYVPYLTQLSELDLSNNNLTGDVPQSLVDLKFLTILNLSGNNLSGTVPKALLDKKRDGSLKLNVEGNPRLCASESCKPKKDVLIPVVASVASVAVVIAALAFFFVLRRKRRKGTGQQPDSNIDKRSDTSPEPSIATHTKSFTYSEVLKMTDNFERVIGQGGFGVVYHGRLNNGAQVAVKMLSQLSAQGYKQYKAEVKLLLRVHHKNLVSLVGYCYEGNNLALIYEYMAHGNLKEHLSGKRSSNALSWASRLKIVVETAQGLEYLHNGCKPPMVHRDVKTTNILLNENLQAKLADFGLSRSFPIEGETHVSTDVAGTLGYLDPEYYRINWLTEKSDVYSFGIILLEIISNQFVIDKTRERSYITEWVSMMLNKGDIQNVVDPKLHGQFDNNSAWKAIELAMFCVNPSSAERPTMAYVVIELNECLAAEGARTGGSQGMDSKIPIELNMSFGTELAPRPR